VNLVDASRGQNLKFKVFSKAPEKQKKFKKKPEFLREICFCQNRLIY